MADDIREVFISYHKNSAGKLVRDIADNLESAGISCWYANRDMPSGGDFARDIPPKIDGCKVFLLILNEGATHSRHIENEIGLAFRRYNKGEKIDILPYQVEKCEFARWLDYYLIHIQIQSAETMDIGALVKVVAGKLGREAAKNGQCGPDAKWTFKDHILTISRGVFTNDGRMGDFYPQNIPECSNAPWWSEHDKIKSVIIERGITNIGSYAFAECSNLTNIIIPDSVTSIGRVAFANCRSLTSVNLPNSVLSIGETAFHGCVSLSNVNIPQGVTRIKGGTFFGCSGLTNVTIPESVTNIDSWAFADCSNLSSVSIAAEVTITHSAFDTTTEVIRRPQ